MDDTCAVCADTLEWVAYGPCLHREVCSTCIIRLRFICDDFHCCICKSQSNTIFVTKALGDYTRMVCDFKALREVSDDGGEGNSYPSEGKVGQFWYHEGTKAYFDNFDHYKMIKATCRLSCNVCNKKDGRSKEFNSIEQLKSHLFHRHRLFMCSLCLEGRKIFISEQKLYNRAQLTQHVKTGDSVVDGSESERGGFMGHPMCEFCHDSFYGDNELYLHMSTEHFTCHICQRCPICFVECRQHPGRYEYYNNYDNLEIHFRHEHFLCEDETCLAKKFIVFTTESDLKKHNVMEHGGCMSRFKRSAALQIPKSFRFRQIEHDRRGGDRGNCSSGCQMSVAIQDNVETANAERFPDVQSNISTVSTNREENEVELIVNPFQSLATTDSEPPSSRYHQVVRRNSGSAPLEQSSFPPLPIAPSSSQQRSRNDLEGLSGNTMAARLRRRNMVKVLHSSRALPAANNCPNPLPSISYQPRSAPDFGVLSSSSFPGSSQSKPAKLKESVPFTHASSFQTGPSMPNGLAVSSNFGSSSMTSNSNSKVSRSNLAANPADRRSSDKSIANSFSVSATQVDIMLARAQPLLKVEDVQSANKALVEKIRAALEFNEDKFTAFKMISTEYRKDMIDTAEYLAYVHQFGLSHLVLELARLCPNAEKQRELVEIYNYNARRNSSTENCLTFAGSQLKSKRSSKKGKEKCDDNGISSSENKSAHSINNGVVNLQSNHKLSMEELEVLSKHRHSGEKGKSKILVDERTNLNLSMEPKGDNVVQSTGGSSKKNVGAGGGGNKPRKKTSKFLRNRLGDFSATSLQDAGSSDTVHEENEEKADGNRADTPELLPVHGVWQNGGGRRLVVMTRDHKG